MTTNADLLAHWRASGLTKADYWRAHLTGDLTYAAFIGRLWRAERALAGAPDLFRVDLGRPWTLPAGDYVVVGDVQLPTTDYDFAALPLAIGREYLKKGQRHLILAGDLINADAFSTYENDVEEVAFSREIEAAQQFFDEYLAVFDRIWYLTGNHERRVFRRTRLAIPPSLLLKLMTRSPRVQISNWGHCVIQTDGGSPYRVTHARNYSVNQLAVADQLAQKYQTHIIQHHEHHCGIGWDKFGRYVLINNGGLFNPSDMAYAVLDDGKSPNMKNGFTLLRNGHPHLFSQAPMTDWDFWLSARRKIIPLAA